MQSFLKNVISIAWGEVFIATINIHSKTIQLTIGALLGVIAVMLQSAGIFTGFGYLLSMMTTGPLVLASLLSIKIGLMTYIVTAILLVILQPSEFLVFVFTTGILGLGLGVGLKYLKRRILIISFAALCLTAGIISLLYGLRFPILGPSVTSQFSFRIIIGIFVFSLLYSWIWMRLSVAAINRLNQLIPKR